MALAQYLKRKQIKVPAFAAQIGARSRTTIYRYLDGVEPDGEFKARIFVASAGEVQPNSWLGLPAAVITLDDVVTFARERGLEHLLPQEVDEVPA